MDQSTFGEELRRLREQRGLSLKKFAKLVHYDAGYLSKIENSLKPPTETLAKACDEALGAGARLSTLVSTRETSMSSRRTQDGVHLSWKQLTTTDSPERYSAASRDRRSPHFVAAGRGHCCRERPGLGHEPSSIAW